MFYLGNEALLLLGNQRPKCVYYYYILYKPRMVDQARPKQLETPTPRGMLVAHHGTGKHDNETRNVCNTLTKIESILWSLLIEKEKGGVVNRTGAVINVQSDPQCPTLGSRSHSVYNPDETHHLSLVQPSHGSCRETTLQA